MRVCPTLCLLVSLFGVAMARAEEPRFTFEHQPPRLEIRLDGQPIATYVYRDERITRPYFCDLRTREGNRVTRNHPPIAGQDLTDHDTFHPGMWLAFGDLDGSDFWRIKAPVEHAGFIAGPSAEGDRATFAVKNRYRERPEGRVIGEETCTYTWTAHDDGYLIETASEFSSDDAAFAFGDQEEMGLGVRLATPLIVQRGGAITNSEGDRDEAGAWGKPATWCDYSGTIDGTRLGVLMMPSAANFRGSWFHVRDYGLMVGNPFGREAMTGGEPSRVEVLPNTPWRLGYGVFVYQRPHDAPLAHADIYDWYRQRQDAQAPAD